jgi:DNA-binding response OmpR family regulator
MKLHAPPNSLWPCCRLAPLAAVSRSVAGSPLMSKRRTRIENGQWIIDNCPLSIIHSQFFTPFALPLEPVSYIASMRLLVVEDFQPLRDSLVQGLREAGFAVDEAADGQTALWHARNGEHDVIVLDIMLPKVDGLSVLRQLRERNVSPRWSCSSPPRTRRRTRSTALELGADDYLVKPFVFAELLARVRAMIRRKYETTATDPAHRRSGGGHHSPRRAPRRQTRRSLSGREYALLEYLGLNAGRIVSRADIWQHVYDFNASPESNVVDVYIGLLRKKIERPGSPRLIHTRRGQGYLLAELEPA